MMARSSIGRAMGLGPMCCTFKSCRANLYIILLIILSLPINNILIFIILFIIGLKNEIYVYESKKRNRARV